MTLTRRGCLVGLALAGLSAGCGSAPAKTAARPVTTHGQLRVIAPAPIKGRTGHHALWTGAEMLVWGGATAGQSQARLQPVSDGAAYRPETDSWRLMADMSLGRRGGMAVVWTGQVVLCWGGEVRGEGERIFADGAAYDPQADRWTTLALPPVEARSAAAAVWTGSEMLLWAGRSDCGEMHAKNGAAYNPDKGAWRPIPPAPLPDFYEHAVVWTGQEMIVFVGAFGDERNAVIGAAYDPASDSWRAVKDSPVVRGWGTAVWADGRILLLSTAPDMVTGGKVNPFPTPLAPIGAYVPDTDSWAALTRSPALHRGGFIWTGEAAAFWNGDPTAGLAYVAGRDRWVRLPAHDGPLREFPSAVWTGKEIIVWGGHSSYGPGVDGPLRPLDGGVALRLDPANL